MGLGKTFVATEKAETFNENIIVVVCQKSKIEDWKEHYEVYYPHYKAISYNKDLKSIDQNTVLIINYDLIWRREQFRKLRDYTLILDESSYIKNSTSKRTKYIMKLRPTNIILLSGTPTGGKYEELYTQIKLLNWDISKKSYWNTYIKWIDMDVGGFKKPRVTGYKNIERLKRKLREHGAVFMKTEEVITLPDTLNFNIHAAAPKEYKTFNKDSIVTVDHKELIGETTLTKMLYLRQLAGMYNKNKYEKLIELLESTEERLIIFYNFKEEFKNIKDICKKLNKPISIVNGDTRDLKNYESLENTITLIQYQAGSMGLNLQKARTIIYFSPNCSSDLFEQSKKRTHRLGQTQTCKYYYLITKGSIEEKIYKSLAERKDYTDKLFSMES